MYTVGMGSSGGKGYDWGQSFNSVGESVRLIHYRVWTSGGDNSTSVEQ